MGDGWRRRRERWGTDSQQLGHAFAPGMGTTVVITGITVDCIYNETEQLSMFTVITVRSVTNSMLTVDCKSHKPNMPPYEYPKCTSGRVIEVLI